MNQTKNRKHKKTLAVLLVAFMLIGILSSHKFIIDNAHHDCTGENCPICLQIEAAVSLIRSIKYVPILSFLMAALIVFTKREDRVEKQIYARNTLISLKVELLN